MRKIFAIVLFLLYSVSAEAQEYGCFVGNVNGCSDDPIICDSSYQTNVEYFGMTVAGICANYNAAFSDYYSCQQDWARLTNGNRLLNVLLVAQNRKMHRLYAACGNKCRKIK